jgi:hypothetical protein
MAAMFISVLFAMTAVTNAQVIRVGQRDTIYDTTHINVIYQDCPTPSAPAIDLLLRPWKDDHWPVLDQGISTLRINADSTMFFICNGVGANFYKGTLASPFGSLSSRRNPNSYATQMNELLYYQTVTSFPSPSRRARNVFTLRYDIFHNCWLDEIWIPNVYKVQASDVPKNNPSGIKAGDLLGLVHVETLDGPGTGVRAVYSMGLAYSSDAGLHWAYCGDIIRTGCNTGNGTNNIAGTPYIIYTDAQNTKWLYVYYNEFGDSGWYNHNPRNFKCGKRQCVARDTLPDVLTKARYFWNSASNINPTSDTIHVPKFHKYKGFTIGWSRTSAVNQDTGAQIIPPCPSVHVPFNTNGDPDSLLYDFDSDAAYCKALKKYLITVSNGPYPGAGSQSPFGALMLYSSIDGVNWGNPIIVDTASLPGFYIEKAHSFFAALDTSAADDCHEVGKQFYIYFPFTYWQATRTQDFFRRQISVGSDIVPINMLLEN